MLCVICLSGFLWFTRMCLQKQKDITLKGYTIGHRCIQVQLTDSLSIVIQGHSLFLCLRVNLASRIGLLDRLTHLVTFP